MDDVGHFLFDLTIVLTVAAVTTVLAHRLKLPVVVGYVVAGLLVGAARPLGLELNREAIQTLSELGVILLLFSIGLEFSLRRLARLVPVVGVAAAVEVTLMMGMGYTAARLVGWTGTESLFAGAIVAISSTMIVAKSFEERKPSRRLQDLVLGVLLMEDLVAILLLVLLSTAAGGVGSDGIGLAMLKLLGFLVLLLVGGMLIVPRAMRLVAGFKKKETTLVASVAIAFLFALLAEFAGYSVALGAFVAGSLVRESGTAHRVLEVLPPVRDLFAAIFFVSVGLLVQPGAVLEAWPIVLTLTLVVFTGKFLGVSIGGFLAGFGVRTSVQGAMTLAQIGEFSFVIAGLALTTGVAPPSLYAVAVAVSVITSLATPTLMRLADPVSALIDRRLPRPVQTVVTLYESWIELMRRGTGEETTWHRIRRPLRWMFLDAAMIGSAIVGLSLFGARVRTLLVDRGVSEQMLIPLSVGIGFLVLAPFAIGMVTSARRVAVLLAEAAMPKGTKGMDPALAPRGVLVNVLQIASVVVLGLPLLVITQPFLSVWPAAGGLALLLLLLTVGFFRSARNLQGHARAGAELIVDVLSRQGVDKDEHSMEVVQEMLPGMGTIVPFQVVSSSTAVGRALGELNLRGLTGVTVVALCRGPTRIIFPDARQVLESGDVLALTGSHDALATANRLLSGPAAEGAGGPA